MSRGDIRLTDAASVYIQMRTSKMATTTSVNEAFVIRRFIAAVGDRQLRHLHRVHVTNFFYGPSGVMGEHRTSDGRMRPAVEPSTHNFYRLRLKAFFAYCTSMGWLREDLLVDVERMRLVDKNRTKPSPEVLLSLIDLTDNPRDRAFIAMAVNTALRASEMKSLRVGDVDLRDNTVHVRVSKSSLEDAMPMTSDLAQELAAWLHEYALLLGRPLRREDYLFPARKQSVYRYEVGADGLKHKGRTEATWRPERPASHWELIVQNCLRKLGLPTKHEGVRTIRRGVARAFFDYLSEDKGFDKALRTVSALLHHKSVVTTECYLGFTSERHWRDQRLRGKPFLSAMVEAAEVIPLLSIDPTESRPLGTSQPVMAEVAALLALTASHRQPMKRT